MKILSKNKKEIVIRFNENTVGCVIRNMRNLNSYEPTYNQHIDCILPSGEPVGFFGRPGPGSSGPFSASWNSLALNEIGNVFGYDRLLLIAPELVDLEEAMKKNVLSGVLILQFPEKNQDKAHCFHKYWVEAKGAKKGELKPFHIIGRNCSTFAYNGFKESNILNERMSYIFDTPRKLFDALIRGSKNEGYTLKCYFGHVGFIESTPRSKPSRINECKNYDLIISNYESFDI